MKHKLKIITLLTLGTLSATVMAQTPNQPTQQPSVVTSTGTKVEVPAQAATNDYSNIGEGNAYEKAVTPLLREISRKKSILELKKLDKEIAKLDEVEKKEPASGFVPMPAAQPAQTMKTTAATTVEDAIAVPVKVLMTYGADDDLYAKIAVGDQGGYTVRKGDILPDGRSVLKVSSNFIEVQKAVKTSKSVKNKTEKIFVSAATPSTPTNAPAGLAGAGGTNSSNMSFTPVPSSTMPTVMPIPAVNTATTSNIPLR